MKNFIINIFKNLFDRIYQLLNINLNRIKFNINLNIYLNKDGKYYKIYQ